MTTRTHTERVDRTGIGSMSDELVARSSELGTHTRITELRTVDHIGVMLDPHSHREWLLDDIESFREDHLIGITSRVTDRDDEYITLNPLFSIDDDSRHSPIYYLYISHTSTKANIRTKRKYLFAKLSHEDSELVRSHMSLGLVHDLLWGSRCNHLLEYILAAWIVDHRIELAITESPRSPFAVLDIGLGIEWSSFHEHTHIDESSLDGLASIDDEWIESGSSESQSCKKSSRASTHDDRTCASWIWRNYWDLIHKLFDIFRLMFEEIGLGEIDIFLFEIDIDTIDK